MEPDAPEATGDDRTETDVPAAIDEAVVPGAAAAAEGTTADSLGSTDRAAQHDEAPPDEFISWDTAQERLDNERYTEAPAAQRPV